ncbi:hypothetical protein [Methylobacterium nodulans]|uniref:Putative PAS/PAC sensor protein n=1 Tax=Methylobacterium nodulans (strain LMG 21967 / CNCM I-2342 / ORS 2060) TaxID=460265 RepID=B8IMQ1_METNO|nr:hypothetical protein [Methylobacterium nodulans]ACL60244.1 putative PAS/PAC sensor protein [Methylobacterium nodulans ORS 2060]
MTPARSKAARAVLRWTTRELSSRSGVALHTLSKFEDGDHLNREPRERLRAEFEAAGVELHRDGYGLSLAAIGDR